MGAKKGKGWLRRGWFFAGLFFAVVVVFGLSIVPSLVARAAWDRKTAVWQKRWQVEMSYAGISALPTSVTIQGLQIRDALEPKTLLLVDSVTVRVSLGDLLRGKVTVKSIAIVRPQATFSTEDVAKRKKDTQASANKESLSATGRMRIVSRLLQTEISVSDGNVVVVSPKTNMTASVTIPHLRVVTGKIEGTLAHGEVGRVREISDTAEVAIISGSSGDTAVSEDATMTIEPEPDGSGTRTGSGVDSIPLLRFNEAGIRGSFVHPTAAVIDIHEAEARGPSGFSIRGIRGQVRLTPRDVVTELWGSFDDPTVRLWALTGQYDFQQESGSGTLRAQRFTFDKIRSLLTDLPLVDIDKTSLEVDVSISIKDKLGKLNGKASLNKVSIDEPRLAEETVREVDVSMDLDATIDADSKSITIKNSSVTTGDVTFSVDAEVSYPVRSQEALAKQNAEESTAGTLPITPPASSVGPQFSLQVAMLPTKCQSVLASIPPALVPHLQGYVVDGIMEGSMSSKIVVGAPQSAEVSVSTTIDNCLIQKSPRKGVRRLRKAFRVEVPLTKDRSKRWTVGPKNPSFVPYDQISPYLIASVLTTEDSNFLKHRGFIRREFQSALRKNLEAKYFRYGASSITMQMIKNTVLSREKTLSRKLQELFLTWHAEKVLSKQRILEIYFNVIEYGPSLYGIGPASQFYFGKKAKDLLPEEAAFFSSILPAPRKRYIQACRNKLSKWSQGKIARILETMHQRGRLDLDEWRAAAVRPLAFEKAGQESHSECLRRASKSKVL